jgi:hypothetical protein
VALTVTDFGSTFRLYRCDFPADIVQPREGIHLQSLPIGKPMTTGDVPRARRYETMFAIQYRQRFERRWQSGITHNVSASGVLFGEAAGDGQLQLDAPIEMELIIPTELLGGAATRVLCLGRVIRIVEACAVDKPRVIAATISKYRLLRSADPVKR